MKQVVLLMILSGFGNWSLQGQVAKGTWMVRGNTTLKSNSGFNTHWNNVS